MNENSRIKLFCFVFCFLFLLIFFFGGGWGGTSTVSPNSPKNIFVKNVDAK